jgi:hypothetical protein
MQLWNTVDLMVEVHMQSTWTCTNISHIQVFVTNFLPTPSIKLKLGLQVGGRLLIATHLDQSNYLANQKQQGAVNKHYWIVFIRLFQDSTRALKGVQFFRVPAVLEDSLDLTNEPHPRFPVEGHILSIGGDALKSYGRAL